MPFTIHPDQKTSDDDAYWKRFIEEQDEKNALAASLCKLHAENVRVARICERAIEAERAAMHR